MSSSTALVAPAPMQPRTVAPSRIDNDELDFAAIYEENVAFVWRLLRRLGVPEASVEDALQDVFGVAHRKLGEFEGRSSLRTWLYGIALRVARVHRRRAGRAQLALAPAIDACASGSRPDEETEHAEALRLLDRLLGELDEDKREILVLADIRELTVPEISELLGIQLSNAYWRLGVARKAFEAAVRRHRARERRRGM